MEINTKDLKLAQIRYFDVNHNGVVVPPIEAYALLLKTGDQYINILNPLRDYPVYERVPYSNTTLDGWEFGTKIIHVYGECQDGLCYVIEMLPMEDSLRVKTITVEELEEIAVKSKLFFIDLFELHRRKRNIVFDGQYRQEQKKMKMFQEYLDSCEKARQYHK